MMCIFILSLILVAIASSTAANPILADSNTHLETAVLNFGDDETLDYQLFDGQPSGDQWLPQNQEVSTDAFNTNSIGIDDLVSQDVSDLDGVDSSYWQAFLDESSPPIDPTNPENRAYYAAACDTDVDTDVSSSSSPLRARDLNDILKFILPDQKKEPFCTNPTFQPPTLQPEWFPRPVVHPLNQARCPVETDGIQPIALCCYAPDFGMLGDRIAVARDCYTCEFGIHCRCRT